MAGETIAPRTVRVVLGGRGLSGFFAGPFTDHYVKLQLPPRGAPYAPPFDAAQIRQRLQRRWWPVTRTYTVRQWDPIRGELTIDFVVHGDEGTAGPWAADARPGDELQLGGPGGAYAPHPDAAWHLMIGDASVLPAISASLARVRPETPVEVVVELDDPAEQPDLPTAADLTLHWVAADGTGAALVAAVAAVEFPDGDPQVFLHGEASSVRTVRRHLIVDRGLSVPAMASVSGYWKRSRTEDGWREDKPEWRRLVELDGLAAGDAR